MLNTTPRFSGVFLPTSNESPEDEETGLSRGNDYLHLAFSSVDCTEASFQSSWLLIALK